MKVVRLIVARIGETRNAYKIVVLKPEVIDHLVSLGLDGRTTLDWILGKSCGKVWTGCI
jgi:hypothetical protein